MDGFCLCLALGDNADGRKEFSLSFVFVNTSDGCGEGNTTFLVLFDDDGVIVRVILASLSFLMMVFCF